MTQLIPTLNWRYATKKFDSSRSISDNDLSELLEVVRLTPTSYGIPAFRLLRVTSPDLRQQLKPAAYNQSQVVDASELLVFVTPKQLTQSSIDQYLHQVADVRQTPLESLSSLGHMLQPITQQDSATQTNWLQKQAYVGLGFLLLACGLKQIDACPMEGFISSEINRILGINEDETVCLLCPIGYRHSSDDYSTKAKVRPPTSQFVETK